MSDLPISSLDFDPNDYCDLCEYLVEECQCGEICIDCELPIDECRCE